MQKAYALYETTSFIATFVTIFSKSPTPHPRVFFEF